MEKNEKMEQEKELSAVGQEVGNETMDSHEPSREKLDENWKDYLTNHMFNYKVACVKGEIFDKINSYEGKLYCFPVKDGCHIESEDVALLNQYCEAFAIGDYSVPDEERLMSEIVGTVDLVVNMRNGQDIIFVREMGMFKFDNSPDADFAITSDDICNACYLEDAHTVCNDALNPFAGQVVSVEGNTVTVFVSLKVKDRKKWVWDESAWGINSNEKV